MYDKNGISLIKSVCWREYLNILCLKEMLLHGPNTFCHTYIQIVVSFYGFLPFVLCVRVCSTVIDLKYKISMIWHTRNEVSELLDSKKRTKSSRIQAARTTTTTMTTSTKRASMYALYVVRPQRWANKRYDFGNGRMYTMRHKWIGIVQIWEQPMSNEPKNQIILINLCNYVCILLSGPVCVSQNRLNSPQNVCGKCPISWKERNHQEWRANWSAVKKSERKQQAST